MKARKVAFLGVSIALALILSFVESQIPMFAAVPGMKVGLPNLVMVFLLYRVGWRETVIVSLIRVLLVSILFGNVQSLVFSVAGGSGERNAAASLAKNLRKAPSQTALFVDTTGFFALN